jgi:MinD-like ATPase involved in chromosome partitioning or flagellar assembly
MILYWAAKGGSGTTVVAAASALLSARHRPTLLVDLAGDCAVALGSAEPAGPGVLDWLASPTAGADALHRLAVDAADQLQLIPAGRGTADPQRWDQLAAALAAMPSVVVDAGTGTPPDELHQRASQSLLVTRACFLSLRRAVQLPLKPTGIVLVSEPGRALGARDIEHALGAPVVAEVLVDPAVARAVDAGLLAARLPRSLVQQLRAAA